MTFRRHIPRSRDEDRGEVFAPVADLMVGVVFVFILLALGLALRADRHQLIPRAEHERVVAELERLRGRLSATETALAGVEHSAEQRAEQIRRLVGLVRFIREEGVLQLIDRIARADETRGQILGDIRRRLQELGVEVALNRNAGTLALPASSLFASGRSDPSVEGRDTVMKLGRVLDEVLPCYAGGEPRPPQTCPRRQDAGSLSAVYVEGHTDVTPYGTPTGRFRNNWDLSAGRAIETFTVIRNDFERIRDLRNAAGQPLVGVSGYAETRPALPEGVDRTGPVAMERDRRIEVRLLMGNETDRAAAALRALQDRLEKVRDIVE